MASGIFYLFGYRITLALFDKSRPPRYEVFAEGWLQGSKVWVRPMDRCSYPMIRLA